MLRVGASYNRDLTVRFKTMDASGPTCICLLLGYFICLRNILAAVITGLNVVIDNLGCIHVVWLDSFFIILTYVIILHYAKAHVICSPLNLCLHWQYIYVYMYIYIAITDCRLRDLQRMETHCRRHSKMQFDNERFDVFQIWKKFAWKGLIESKWFGKSNNLNQWWQSHMP